MNAGIKYIKKNTSSALFVINNLIQIISSAILPPIISWDILMYWISPIKK